MFDGRPVWQHHCEQCFACLQWCPKEAIQNSVFLTENPKKPSEFLIQTGMTLGIIIDRSPKERLKKKVDK